MVERGRGKRCGDCANWKVKDSPCTYYDDIVKGILAKTDAACEDFFPKEKERTKAHKTSGYSEQGHFEAIYHKGQPAFLTANKDIYKIMSEVFFEGAGFLPKESNEYPYQPYDCYEGEVPSREELFWKVRDEFNLFLDLDSIWKDYLAACVLLSYQQEKIRTVPYPFFLGDNESGKTVAQSILGWLCYRPLSGVSIPVADVYGFLDDSDSPGVIIEDEVQGIYKDIEKSKILKAGYKCGAVVPRTIITQNKRSIKYFRVFCLKIFAAEELPRVKGLLERLIIIPMVEGYPTKDWADFDKEDQARLNNLRNMLLKWRLATKDRELPEINLSVKGRLKELWKPILQIINGLTIEEDLRKHLDMLQKERLNEKTNTIEGHIVKVVCKLYHQDNPLAFSEIWDELVLDLEGKLDEKKPNKMDTAEFAEITKQKIGYRLREVLGGKKVKVRDHEGPAVFYAFNAEKLTRIGKKYAVPLLPKLQNERATTPLSQPQTPITEQSKTLEENSNQQPTQLTTNLNQTTSPTPPKADKLENLGTNQTIEELASHTKSLTRLQMNFGEDRCPLCQKQTHVEWQTTNFDESWAFLCGPCVCKLSQKLTNNP
jgi:hypothetical protein